MRLAKGYQKKTPFSLLIPKTEKHNGIVRKAYEPDNITRLCNFSTYGGDEREVNGVIAIEDTATVVTWYDPQIQSGCAIRLLESGKDYEIISEPEDIELRHQEMSFKVKRIKGGA